MIDYKLKGFFSMSMPSSKIQNLFSLIIIILSFGLGSKLMAHNSDATPENLKTFELPQPLLTQTEKLQVDAEVEEQLKFEKWMSNNINYMSAFFKKYFIPNALFGNIVGEDVATFENKPEEIDKKFDVEIEIYQNKKILGKQFLLAKENGQLRYVFAISAAGQEGKETPEGDNFTVLGQLWRHMSTLYPGKKENNMDHVTYFAPSIGFHSTTFGLYYKLGTADSHGCVRMARPEARAIYALIREHGSMNTIVRSYKTAPPLVTITELDLIKRQLAFDLNFIKNNLIKKKTNGDIPFNEKEYFAYKSGALPKEKEAVLLSFNNLVEIVEINPEMDLFLNSNTSIALK